MRGFCEMLSEEEKSEMRVLYRQAANRRRQIEILAQLYAAPKEDVLEALGLDDLPESAHASKQPKTARRCWPDGVRRAAVERVLAGQSYRQAAEACGVPVNTIGGWMATWQRTHRNGKAT